MPHLPPLQTQHLELLGCYSSLCLSVCVHSSAVNVKMMWHNQIPLHLSVCFLPSTSLSQSAPASPLFSVKFWTKCLECCGKSQVSAISCERWSGLLCYLSPSYHACYVAGWANRPCKDLCYSHHLRISAWATACIALCISGFWQCVSNKKGPGGVEVDKHIPVSIQFVWLHICKWSQTKSCSCFVLVGCCVILC